MRIGKACVALILSFKFSWQIVKLPLWRTFAHCLMVYLYFQFKNVAPGGLTFFFTTNIFIQILGNGAALIATPDFKLLCHMLSFRFLDVRIKGFIEAKEESENQVVINDICVSFKKTQICVNNGRCPYPWIISVKTSVGHIVSVTAEPRAAV